ncbi:DUF3283 family protein [Salinimonas marina]|uniref:DUF3283 family protein n=1 Tax=Salinimonas marina TaxID=2785918 RepID=A0A7S9DYZ4_9ALTE|nr:DUF3283 family protein [Salinimonas marina]
MRLVHLLPLDEQKPLQRDLKASLMAWKIATGKTTRAAVTTSLAKLGLNKYKDMCQRLDKYLAMHPSYMNANSVNVPPIYTEQSPTRGRVIVRGSRPKIARSRAGQTGSSDGLWSVPVN